MDTIHNSNAEDEFLFGRTQAILDDMFDLVDKAYFEEYHVDYLVESCRIALDKMISLYFFRCDSGDDDRTVPHDQPPQPSVPDSLCTKLLTVTKPVLTVHRKLPLDTNGELCKYLTERKKQSTGQLKKVGKFGSQKERNRQ